MVNALLFFVIPLGVAFSLALIKSKAWSFWVVVSTLALIVLGAVKSFLAFTSFSSGMLFYTAGFRPPISIAFGMSKPLILAVGIVSLTAIVFYFFSNEYRKDLGAKFDAIFMIFIAGINGLILTQDIFNLFIFNEIVAISLAAIVITKSSFSSWSAGFKYFIVASVLTGILLLAITFFYASFGTLYIRDILSSVVLTDYRVSIFIPLLLLLTFLLVELKAFPFNGWALDLYQSSNSLVGMLMSTVVGLGTLAVFYKLMPLLVGVSKLVSYILLLSFVVSNLLAVKQKSLLRLLGYSSAGYISLIAFSILNKALLGNVFFFVVFGFIITHIISKVVLFILAKYVKKDTLLSLSYIKSSALMVFVFTVSIFALAGFPPLPSFFAKWELIYRLSLTGNFVWISLILLGSFFEAVYLFKWFGDLIKSENTAESTKVSLLSKVSISSFAVLLLVSPILFIKHISLASTILYWPILLVFAFVLVDKLLPAWVKNTLAISVLSYYAYTLFPNVSGYRYLFTVIFIIGGIATLLPGYYYKGKREGFYPFVMMMFLALGGLITAHNWFDFFYNWELMTLGSYILILRGKKAKSHAYSYMLFSVGGAYLMLYGIALVNSSIFNLDISAMATLSEHQLAVYLLFFMAFMTKTASAPFHIWLPGAHAEAESDVSPMVSAILLKAGVLGIVILMLLVGDQKVYGISVNYVLSWVGVITALLGNMAAAVQKDAKRLLAYSSVGQLGYALFALTFMTHLAWLAGFAMAINHFLFKAMLFWAIGGVYIRTHTKQMHEMGGLISRMPFTFITVLIAIIAVSGIPPLSGFAGKWLMFNAVVEKGWYLQGALAAFAGVVGFLYLFKLIHTIFLGQLKDEHRNVKEAPFWFILPQYLFIAAIMFFSAVPGFILKPIGRFLNQYFSDTALTWTNGTAHSFLGYWNPRFLMIVTIIMFAIVFVWLWLTKRKSQKVKQFNIVYAGERPFRPETTHYAYNFYGHFKRAFSFFYVPRVINFWNSMTGFYKMFADFIRRLYTGDIQTYVTYIILFIIIVFWVVI